MVGGQVGLGWVWRADGAVRGAVGRCGQVAAVMMGERDGKEMGGGAMCSFGGFTCARPRAVGLGVMKEGSGWRFWVLYDPWRQ